MARGLLVRLRPNAPWRIGPDSGDRERVETVLHSDAVYSAVTSAIAMLGGLEEWLAATASGTPAVRFSSCFPFIGNTLLVTPPRNLWPPAPSAKVRYAGAKFVPLSVIESLLAEKPLNEDALQVDGASECLLPQNVQGPFRVRIRSNAAVDREGVGVETHRTACIEFGPEAGLWMVVEFANDEAEQTWKPIVKSALHFLADHGVGGERSRGWGRSEAPEIVEGELPSLVLKLPEGASGDKGHWLLSLFHPSEEDAIDWQRGSYSVTTRSGRVEATGAEKSATRMVSEGSVLVGAVPKGSVRDVAPEGFAHPVYRNGFALSIEIPLKAGTA
jgi:CRISPR type III-A-associated RAMP protein Csm4